MAGHIHLDPVGGLSGDMFIATMLSLAPEAEAPLRADLTAAGLDPHATLDITKARKNGFACLQADFRLHPAAPPTHHWRDIRAFLTASALRPAVKTRALAIFQLLAEAEAACHDLPVENVHFHEIADWDSVADIVAAASLIETLGAESWSVSSLPLGRGRAMTQHGLIPLPAPATAHLLTGFATHDDGEEGERVTPTGAAILRALAPTQSGPPQGARIAATGTGAGQRSFKTVANICRALRMETAALARDRDRVAEIGFEIDDMTPEEISVALDRIRADAAVIDAGYTLGYGKKGRVRYAVTVLAQADAAEQAADLCFAETSTLGLRLGEARRLILARRAMETEGLRVKQAERPGGATAKAESDDLADTPTLKARRARAARAGDV